MDCQNKYTVQIHARLEGQWGAWNRPGDLSLEGTDDGAGKRTEVRRLSGSGLYTKLCTCTVRDLLHIRHYGQCTMFDIPWRVWLRCWVSSYLYVLLLAAHFLHLYSCRCKKRRCEPQSELIKINSYCNLLLFQNFFYKIHFLN